MNIANSIREGVRCRLCWRITFAIFVLILVAEAAVLLPSVHRFQRAERERIAERAEARVENLLLGADGVRDRALESRLLALAGQIGVESLAVYWPDGSHAIGLGREPFPGPPPSPGVQDWRGRSTVPGEFSWRSESPGAPLVAVRLGEVEANDALIAYVVRVVLLVAIIVLIVTVGTMYVLDRWVLRAMLRLRESALHAAAAPADAEMYSVRSRRRDELGELIAAHNSMLAHISESSRRDKATAAERQRYLERHQQLTGLPNRRALIEHVAALRQRDGEDSGYLSLLLLNITQFRLLNTTLGSEHCDEILLQMAHCLRHRASPGDFLAHLGADRFAVIVESARFSAAEISALAAGVLHELGSKPMAGGGGSGGVGFSIGISECERRAADGLQLLNEAELALARLSNQDSVRYLFFSPDLATEVRERRSLTRDLDRAIRDGELFAVLQPKWTLTAEQGICLSGAEALIRWRHPVRGLVRPDQFIALAEATGQIEQIGDFMLRAACGTMRDWTARFGWTPPIAVNVSPGQFSDKALPQRLQRLFDEFSLPAGLLELEITESVAMRSAERTIAVLEELQSIGVRVSVDDFGTGYSSLSYLRKFPIHAIKIDKSFVDDIGRLADAEAICDAVLRLGQSLEVKVIAEGVENESQLAFLRRRRCGEVQGYLLGKPASIPEFQEKYLSGGGDAVEDARVA